VLAHLSAPGTGVRVRDGALGSPSWQGLRPRGLAHLLRTAKGLTERRAAGSAHGGTRVPAALQRLCPRGTDRPTVGQWRAWEARGRSRVNRAATREDNAGTFARRWAREGAALGVWLDVQGVDAPQHSAERAPRCGVLGRKRSQGRRSE